MTPMPLSDKLKPVNLRLFSLALLLLAGLSGLAQQKSDYEARWFIRGTDTLPYRVLWPLQSTNNPPSAKPKPAKVPLLIFLHGSGERGRDNEAQLTHGWKLFADSATRNRYPSIVIFPQCPTNASWAPYQRVMGKDGKATIGLPDTARITRPLQLMLELVDSLAASGLVDKKRIYIGGLSMGGFGTFYALHERPRLFAAAFPICGGGSETHVKAYAKRLPLWVFHGDADPVVLPDQSRRMVEAIRQRGGKVQYTEYPGVGHNSWDNAFAEPGLLAWIYGQRK